MNDTNKIKGKIVENGFTLETLANAIGMSRQTLSKKIKGRKEFTISEVEAICRELKISDDELVSYFFAAKVPKMGS